MSAPQLGLGCVKLGTATSERAEIRLIHQAIDMGFTVFDTADVYGAGSSERVLGKAVRGRRDGLSVATKGGYVVRERAPWEQWLRRRAGALPASVRPSDPRRRTGRSHDPLEPRSARQRPAGTQPRGGGGQDFSADHLRSAVEGSLRRMGLEHIDVYQFHGADRIDDDSMAMLIELREAGVIGSVGLGAENYEAVRETMRTPDLAVVQLPFGLLDPQPLDGIFGQLGRVGRQTWVRGILGGGLVARAMSAPDEALDHPKAATVRALDEVARRWAMPLDELAIRWACTLAPADVVLFGVSSPSHLGRNLEFATGEPLPADVCADVTAVQTRRQ